VFGGGKMCLSRQQNKTRTIGLGSKVKVHQLDKLNHRYSVYGMHVLENLRPHAGEGVCSPMQLLMHDLLIRTFLFIGYRHLFGNFISNRFRFNVFDKLDLN
jgi:hypothetical protein